jgi:hypothetical protein
MRNLRQRVRRTKEDQAFLFRPLPPSMIARYNSLAKYNSLLDDYDLLRKDAQRVCKEANEKIDAQSLIIETYKLERALVAKADEKPG